MIYYIELFIFSVIAVAIIIDAQWYHRVVLTLKLYWYNVKVILTVYLWLWPPLAAGLKFLYYCGLQAPLVWLGSSILMRLDDKKELEKEMDKLL